MSHLTDVANTYEREARRSVSGTKARHLRDTAAGLRYMVGNREAADPTSLRLHMALRLDLPVGWCRRHGYQVAIGYGGLTFQRGDEPAQVASSGDILRWDGRQITVDRP
ncbi:hypothetical protein [Streptomyces sp. NPDC059016]|uniref:hypothetical protein n=1 Tax=Streptomyces sp. NPDC059016 TaxID=3346699 RepID=UPI0036932139